MAIVGVLCLGFSFVLPPCKVPFGLEGCNSFAKTALHTTSGVTIMVTFFAFFSEFLGGGCK